MAEQEWQLDPMIEAMSAEEFGTFLRTIAERVDPLLAMAVLVRYSDKAAQIIRDYARGHDG